MPQPSAVDEAAQGLIGLFEAAQADIEAQLAVFTEGRRAARLRELQRTVGALLGGLESGAREWLQGELPSIYELGGATAAELLGDSFAWSQPHLAAVQALAERSFDDLLAATEFVASDAKAWLRDEARQQLTLSLIEGKGSRAAAKALSDAAGSELGLFAVRYKDGSLHTLDDYADSAVRAVSAETYNRGTINQSRDLGVQFMECQDGSECGWASHDDPEKPNGRVFPIEDAAGAVLSHPRCRRSWLPRIDALSVDAAPLRSEAQIADQAASELASSRRVPRSSRTPRAPRAVA